MQNSHASPDLVSRTVSQIGAAAGVKVWMSSVTGKVKYASAHDLRRSFGERWSRRVMPPDLMILMRHETIQTTMGYYVGRNAQTTSDAVWSAIGQSGEFGNTYGNTRPKTTNGPDPSTGHKALSDNSLRQ